MKKFFAEFKTFITRGNVVDLAVGVIIGGAFTAIVSALTNYVLMPVINWVLAVILGANGLSGIYTFLKWAPSADDATVVDLANSIYIDWGALIGAVINFILIALVLFIIVKTINHVNEKNGKLKEKLFSIIPSKADRKAMKQQGIKLTDKAAVKAYMQAKKEEEERKAEEEKLAAEEEAKKQREENPTAEDLLKDIKAILEAKSEK